MVQVVMVMMVQQTLMNPQRRQARSVRARAVCSPAHTKRAQGIAERGQPQRLEETEKVKVVGDVELGKAETRDERG